MIQAMKKLDELRIRKAEKARSHFGKKIRLKGTTSRKAGKLL